MTIGENIKKARKHAGMTQEELGKKLNVGAATVSAFENDKTNIKFSTAYKFAKALKVPITDIIGENWAIFTDEEIGSVLNSQTVRIEKAIINATSAVSNAIKSLDLAHNRKAMLDAYYDSLNDEGQLEAVKRVEELTYIPKYKKDSED